MRKYTICLIEGAILLGMLGGCGGGDEAFQNTSFRTGPSSPATQARINLVRIYSKGALEAYFTSIDVGIEKYENDGKEHGCRILQPLSDEFRNRSSSPVHLYMNKTEDEYKEGKGKTDVGPVYFADDDNNRNGRNDSFEWTQRPSQEYLKFLNVWEISESEYEFHVALDLGGYKFSGNVRIRAWANENGCEAGAFLCTEVDTQGHCSTNEWPNRIESINVEISAWRYPWGKYIQNLTATPFGGGTPFKIGS